MQMIAGRTAQEYNQRKKRKGAYWEDRYHATIVASDEHLLKCLVYINLNMVRAGVVDHPADWAHGGYQEIQNPPKRYRIIDVVSLMSLLGIDNIQNLQHFHSLWVEEELKLNNMLRDVVWNESLTVGNEVFVNHVQTLLGNKAEYRCVKATAGKHILRETSSPYM